MPANNAAGRSLARYLASAGVRDTAAMAHRYVTVNHIQEPTSAQLDAARYGQGVDPPRAGLYRGVRMPTGDQRKGYIGK